MSVEREWWSVRQFAEHYGISAKAVYRLIDKGELPAYHVPAIRIRNDDRLRWERGQHAKKAEPAAAGREPHDHFWD